MIKPLLVCTMVKTADNYIGINSSGKDIYPFIYRTGNEINCPGICYFICETHNISIALKVNSGFQL